MERLSKKRTFDQEVEADQGLTQPMDFSSGGFPGDLGAPGDLDLEGDSRKTATHMHKKRHESASLLVIQGSNKLTTIIDKIEEFSRSDSSCLATLV